MKKPEIELSDCIRCGVCVEVCPEVFVMNDVGFIQVEDLDSYPEESVDEAIKNCPSDCIYWTQDEYPKVDHNSETDETNI
jgi:ferredoxin